MRGFNSISQNRKNIFFIVLRHVGTSYARSDFLFHKKSVTRSTVPPFPKKVTLRLCCSLVNALATLTLATNLFRCARVQLLHKKCCGIHFEASSQSEQSSLCPAYFLSVTENRPFTRFLACLLAILSLFSLSLRIALYRWASAARL